jgi:pSer/pThr/pTyr-binding forkhead associated (FHA) protein
MRRHALLIVLAQRQEILKKYAFERDVVRIGRDPACDIRLPSGTVSRIHCKIRSVGDKYVLVDNGSRNGVRIDGRLATETALEAGNMIEIEDYRLWVSFAAGGDDPPVSASEDAVVPTLPAPRE